ncbi:MAG: hypothetical protein KDN22_04440 [Verrucomicrobiae bacterium]|nr:hypothetical protein [Verrucomicrobiae bacterium]
MPVGSSIFDSARKASGFKPSHLSDDPAERTVESKLRDWPQNCIRHSFGSYFLERTRDVAATALAMGNTPAVVMRHYHQLVDPDDANAFWSISP